jgi:hypothetical protein
MTRAERLELARLVRLRASVAKKDAEQRQAQLLADVEEQLAARYQANHAAWADVHELADKVVAAADAEIARRCRELGIREDFRPSLSLGWYSRGENADRNRRGELRKVAQVRLEAATRAAKVEIDRQAAALLSELASGALESDAARGFLEAMPSIDDLMPPLTIDALDPPGVKAQMQADQARVIAEIEAGMAASESWLAGDQQHD